MGSGVLDFILHLDKHLESIITQYGAFASYGLLFAILFAETGFVVTPFLPGDSLLFLAGALAAKNTLNIWVLFAVFFAAAVAGDSVNFEIGKHLGPRLFKGEKIPLLKKENLEKTEKFFDKYGGKAIVLARFVPVVRTFAPFVAGTGKMHYGKFITYNLVGGLAWVCLFLGSGYFLGNLPLFRDHFSLVVVVIVLLSLVPVVYEWVMARREKVQSETPATA